jgi:hypothetical protein
MTVTLLHLLAKLEDQAVLRVSDSEIETLAQYLGVNLSTHPKERHLILLKSELAQQNVFLSNEIDADNASSSVMYKKSRYVRELIDRAIKVRATASQEVKGDKRASVHDVEKALLMLCDVIEYPLYIANATEDKKVIRFVAELAAQVFERVQVEFKKLRSQLENEAMEKMSPPKD